MVGAIYIGRGDWVANEYKGFSSRGGISMEVPIEDEWISIRR